MTRNADPTPRSSRHSGQGRIIYSACIGGLLGALGGEVELGSRFAQRQTPGRDPVASSLRGYGSPAPWETGAGQARLGATIAARHEDASHHKWGGGPKTWPSPLTKARKRRRLALKSRRAAGPAHIRQRVVADCGGSYRSGDAGRCGETVPQASRASLPPVLAPVRLGRRAGGRCPKLNNAPSFGHAS
jgi:hypothetical protein